MIVCMYGYEVYGSVLPIHDVTLWACVYLSVSLSVSLLPSTLPSFSPYPPENMST